MIIDPNPTFVERAVGLLAKVPSLRRVLTLGPVPEELAEVGVDLMAAAAAYPPQPLQVARKCNLLTYPTNVPEIGEKSPNLVT